MVGDTARATDRTSGWPIAHASEARGRRRVSAKSRWVARISRRALACVPMTRHQPRHRQPHNPAKNEGTVGIDNDTEIGRVARLQTYSAEKAKASAKPIGA